MSRLTTSQIRHSGRIQTHIWFKRIFKKNYTTYIERTKKGKEQVRRFIAKKYPWYFMLSTQHGYGYTRKGTKLKRKNDC